MSQKVVDLVDLGFPLIKPQKSKYVHVLKRDLVDFVILSERILENLNICMSQNMVDLFDIVFHSQRRLEISNICMSQNVVDLVEFVFHSQRRLKNFNICMSQKVVDLGDLEFPLINAP